MYLYLIEYNSGKLKNIRLILFYLNYLTNI